MDSMWQKETFLCPSSSFSNQDDEDEILLTDFDEAPIDRH